MASSSGSRMESMLNWTGGSGYRSFTFALWLHSLQQRSPYCLFKHSENSKISCVTFVESMFYRQPGGNRGEYKKCVRDGSILYVVGWNYFQVKMISNWLDLYLQLCFVVIIIIIKLRETSLKSLWPEIHFNLQHMYAQNAPWEWLGMSAILNSIVNKN